MTISIMQGRLLPPVDGALQAFPQGRWIEEFPLAKELGIKAMEWVYDNYSNPLEKRILIDQMVMLSQKAGVEVRSICADFFVRFPLLRDSRQYYQDRVSSLHWLCLIAKYAGIKRIVVPFVDMNAIYTTDELVEISTLMGKVGEYAMGCDIEIHLETNLGAMDTCKLFNKTHSSNIFITYDTGNSASMDRDPEEEWEAYGNLIGSIHIKDRIIGGPSVPFGTGAVKWDVIARLIKEYNYHGDFVLQSARGKDGDEIEWTKKNIEFLRKIIE